MKHGPKAMLVHIFYLTQWFSMNFQLLGRTSEFRTLMRIERQTILPRRLAAIREKLSQEGYSRIANHAPHTFWKTPPVFINREWRDYEWPPIRTKCILSSYHLYVADRKRDFPLAFARYLNNLEAFINSFALPEIRPPTIYFASLEPFASIIKETEGFRVLIDTDFRKRIQDLQSIVNKWRETTDEYLLGLVRESLDESAEESADQGLLSCAGVFFKCGFCNEPVSYPRILVHKCLRSKVVDNSAPATSLDCDNGVKLVDFEAGEDRPPKLKAVSMVTEWEDLTKPYRMGAHAGNEAIFFDTNASRIARKIILATGDDPLKITQEEMSAKNIRLECLQCGQGIPKRKRTLASGTRATYRTALCMNWTRAILHELENHANEGTTNRWRQVDSRKDLDSIHNEEAKATKVKNSVINLDTSLQDAPQIVQISTRSNRR
ncbi:hypothetical protein CPB83DRAFT_91200 [Crepidotus variabilis]|uniref:Uncharacterized protein n=1 Tax=Crepidotus variabilis TaxID=179855 RepID=A0A9P6E510_9AGAR|nr:hypothetical protein CPB83DRAFT_91200 [Crepidotus variabilis]